MSNKVAAAKKSNDVAGKNQYHGKGGRKTSKARVLLVTPGSGKIVINKKTIEEYFPYEKNRSIIQQPLLAVNALNSFDFIIRVEGGGTSGQVGAIVHGISNALVRYDEETTYTTTTTTSSENGEESSFRRILRKSKANFLTRDARKVERKKYGLRGARAREQYSKR